MTARAPLAACVSLLLVLGATGAAAQPEPGAENAARLDRVVRFLQDTQNDDGGYGGQPGAESDPLISAWVGIALAAAGINPQDQRAPGRHGPSVAQYLAEAGPVSSGASPPVTTEFERVGMFVNAAGLDPRRFGGRDYVTPLLARQSPEGWFPHNAGTGLAGVNDTIFAIFFLAGAGGGLDEPLQRAATAVEAMQRPDGTWPAVRPGGATNVDMTGAAVQALCAVHRCDGEPVRRALAWLREHQQPDGGWQAGDIADERPGESNSGTTPWVVQALWAAGVDPATWRRNGRDPLDFLASLQRRDGSIRWRASRDLNPTWMTAYAAPAFAGQAWPVIAPPRAGAVSARREKAAARRAARRRARDLETAPGDAGEVASGRGDVTGGGGGRGAPLFSRPQPQSRGATPGGVRDTEHDQARRPGTQGDRGATRTAAASGPGDDGGVQNGERSRRRAPTGDPDDLVTGEVVQQPRGTRGTERTRAIAPGLRAADDGSTDGELALIAFAAAALVALGAGMRLERRPSPVLPVGPTGGATR